MLKLSGAMTFFVLACLFVAYKYWPSESKPTNQKKPKMLMTGGYPGSGKSTMPDHAYPGWKEKYVHIDSDAIKNKLAQADGFKDVGWRASAYHGEADKVLKQLMKAAQDNNMNILYDGTMKTYNKMRDIIKHHNKLGYGFEMAFADLPIEKSMERAMARFMGSSGPFHSGSFLPRSAAPGLVHLRVLEFP